MRQLSVQVREGVDKNYFGHVKGTKGKGLIIRYETHISMAWTARWMVVLLAKRRWCRERQNHESGMSLQSKHNCTHKAMTAIQTYSTTEATPAVSADDGLRIPRANYLGVTD